jgi:hypothetical protein
MQGKKKALCEGLGMLLLFLAGMAAATQVAAASDASIEQQGTGNTASMEQSGRSNQAYLRQTSSSGLLSRNLISARQHGFAGSVVVDQQFSARATAVAYQSPLSVHGTLQILQSASASTAVVEQGVARAEAWTWQVTKEAQIARAGQPQEAFSSNSVAVVSQLGFEGLSAAIIQSGTGQSARILQYGSHLEGAILQSGAAHAASIVQSANGTFDNPYRASVQQSGAYPRSVAIQQIGGNAPRLIQVVQQ